MHKAQNVALLRADPKGELYRYALCVMWLAGRMCLFIYVCVGVWVGELKMGVRLRRLLVALHWQIVHQLLLLLLLLLFCCQEWSLATIAKGSCCFEFWTAGGVELETGASSMGLPVEQRLASSLTLILCWRCCHC